MHVGVSDRPEANLAARIWGRCEVPETKPVHPKSPDHAVWGRPLLAEPQGNRRDKHPLAQRSGPCRELVYPVLQVPFGNRPRLGQSSLTRACCPAPPDKLDARAGVNASGMAEPHNGGKHDAQLSA